MSAKCPENFMSVRTRGPQGAALSEQQRLALIEWAKSCGEKAIADQFGVWTRTISRWKTGKPVARRFYEKLRDALHGRFTAIDPCDPTQYIQRLFEEGQRLHYGCFLPEAAMDVLQQVEFHQSLDAVPPADALNMLALTMSIYRQSMDATEGHFRSCGRRCLNLMSKISLQDYGDRLAASICTVAWELVAVTVQRGWAMEAIPLLERVNRVLDERRLWPHLQISRERSIRRLMHWGRIVAYDRFDDVGTHIRKHGSPIDELSTHLAYSAGEISNVVSQKMWELLRFSMATKGREDRDQATKYFEGTLRPVLMELDRTSRALPRVTHQSTPIRGAITPSTALTIAFQSFVAALHLPLDDASDITECAIRVTDQIHRASDGAVILYKINPETQEFIKTERAHCKLRPRIFEMFPFAGDISQRGKIKLHAIALQLLDRVPDCFRRP
jgi:hypothetical protein